MYRDRSQEANLTYTTDKGGTRTQAEYTQGKGVGSGGCALWEGKTVYQKISILGVTHNGIEIKKKKIGKER